MEYTKDRCIEFMVDGVTYIGKFDKVEDGKFYVKKVMKITLAPIPNPDGKGFTMIPKLELINFYSMGEVFTFDIGTVQYHAEVTGGVFVKGYEDHYEMYAKMKVEQGSDITIVGTDEMPTGPGIVTN